MDVDPAIAFLGYLTSSDRVLSDPSLSLADNRMQHGYVGALRGEFSDVTVFSSVPSSLRQGSAPVDGDDDGVPVRHLGAPTGRLPFAKLVPLVRELSDWARRRPGQPKVLVHYNTFLLYCLAGLWLGRRYGVRIVPIAITLPYSAPDSTPTLSGRIQARLSGRILRSTDGLVAITPFLAEAVNPHVDACVIRGAVPDEALAAPTHGPGTVSSPHRIVYAGNLSQRYNLDAAISMMEHLPGGEYTLHVYGRGALEPLVRAAAAKTADIEFHGAVAEQEVGAVLRDASVLLALLTPDDHLARYSFPSKLFESLLSGTPVIATDLAAMDPAMAEHLFVVEDLDPRGLAAVAVRICSRTPAQREDAAAAARAYLRESCTWSSVGRELRSHFDSLEGAQHA